MAGFILFFAVSTVLSFALAFGLRRLEYKRDLENKKIGGVCAGLAKKSGLRPNLIKIGFVFVTVSLGYLGICLYIACWLILPKEFKEVIVS